MQGNDGKPVQILCLSLCVALLGHFQDSGSWENTCRQRKICSLLLDVVTVSDCLFGRFCYLRLLIGLSLLFCAPWIYQYLQSKWGWQLMRSISLLPWIYQLHMCWAELLGTYEIVHIENGRKACSVLFAVAWIRWCMIKALAYMNMWKKPTDFVMSMGVV